MLHPVFPVFGQCRCEASSIAIFLLRKPIRLVACASHRRHAVMHSQIPFTLQPGLHLFGTPPLSVIAGQKSFNQQSPVRRQVRRHFDAAGYQLEIYRPLIQTSKGMFCLEEFQHNDAQAPPIAGAADHPGHGFRCAISGGPVCTSSVEGEFCKAGDSKVGQHKVQWFHPPHQDI